MFHLNKMSLQNVINMNTSGLNATNPVLTRGEFASSVVAKPLVRGAGAGNSFSPTTENNGVNVINNYPDGVANAGVAGVGCFTDDEAASSAWVVRLGNGTAAGAGNNTYNFNFPASSPLTYNPNLYLEINACSANRSFDATTVVNGIQAVDGNGTLSFIGGWTGRILFQGQFLEDGTGIASLNGTIQLRRNTLRPAGLVNNVQNLDQIVEFRLREIESNDLGLSSYNFTPVGGAAADTQLRDMVVSAVGPVA